jgi:hypothetical protein
MDEMEPLCIPPAVESLAFMEDQLRRQAAARHIEVAAAETMGAELEGERASIAPVVGTYTTHRPSPQPRLVFGQALPVAQRSVKKHQHAGQRLDVFSALQAHRHAPTSPTTEHTQDRTLADPAAMEQRSLFD